MALAEDLKPRSLPRSSVLPRFLARLAYGRNKQIHSNLTCSWWLSCLRAQVTCISCSDVLDNPMEELYAIEARYY